MANKLQLTFYQWYIKLGKMYTESNYSVFLQTRLGDIKSIMKKNFTKTKSKHYFLVDFIINMKI